MSAAVRAQVRLDEVAYTCAVTMGDHRLIADEPRSAGGQDAGPNPYELLAASLGSCTAITVRMYAQRKDWPLEGVQVEVSFDRIHVRDCEDCESEEGLVDRFVKQISFSGDLSVEQRERLLEISKRCPVHRTLLGEIRIESQLV